MNESAKLDKLIDKSKAKLVEVSTVFPFDFTPDTIRVDENKVDIISREFLSTHVLSILITNINTVTISTGPIFATLNFQVNGFVTGEGVKPYPIRYLWKKDAVNVRRTILGLIAATKEHVDLSKVPKNDLRVKIQEIGKSREFTSI